MPAACNTTQPLTKRAPGDPAFGAVELKTLPKDRGLQTQIEVGLRAFLNDALRSTKLAA